MSSAFNVRITILFKDEEVTIIKLKRYELFFSCLLNIYRFPFEKVLKDH